MKALSAPSLGGTWGTRESAGELTIECPCWPDPLGSREKEKGERRKEKGEAEAAVVVEKIGSGRRSGALYQQVGG